MMPHISEGEIHAWLDGGLRAGSERREAVRRHLEMCSDCSLRLEEARQLRQAAGDILAEVSPAPRRAPPLDELVRKARGPAAEEEAAGDRSQPGRQRWRSLERLAWAATVVLAVGAGWIGRQVLTERGWTDPFHVGSSSRVAEVDADTMSSVPEEASAVQAVDRAQDEMMAVGEVRQEEPAVDDVGRRGVNASAPAPGAPPVTSELRARKGVADSQHIEERPGEETASESKERADLAAAEAEGQIQKGIESPAAGDLAFYDVALPVDSRDYQAGDPVGCYSLEPMFESGVDLPRVLELLPLPLESDAGRERSLYAVRLPPGFETMEHGGWVPFAGDSIWVRLGAGRPGVTIRLGPEGEAYEGTATTAGDAAMPGERGLVRVRPVPCAEMDH